MERNPIRPYWRFFEHLHANAVRRETLRFASTWYAGVTLVCAFVLLAASGVLLMYHYVPTEGGSHRSIRVLDEQLRYGGVVRAVHHHAANLMVLALLLHLASLIVRGAHLRRKWANWLVGLALLLLTIALSYTGYLLPYDQLAYWAIMVGSNMAGSAPLVGPLVKQFMLGGEAVSDVTLVRFYVHHCITIAAVFCVFLAIHLYLIRRDRGLTLRGIEDGCRDLIASRPTLYVFEVGSLLLTSYVLLLVSLQLRPPLGPAAHPGVTPNPMKAPWYLVGLQELLHFHSPFVVSYLVPGAVVLFLAALPLLPERWKSVSLATPGPAPKLAGGAPVAFVAFASLVPAYHTNVVFLVNCAAFAAAFCLAQPGRSLHARLGKTPVLVFVLLFLLVSLLLATVVGHSFRGPNWELVV